MSDEHPLPRILRETAAPLVSVVIPTYNRAALLARAIRSVLAQTFDDFELIVVDDASTDDTESVAEMFGGPQVRYIRHETNRNGSAARNTGIRAARGSLLAFLDSDDEWLPTKLAKQVELIEGLNDEWGVVYTGHFRVNPRGRTSVISAETSGRIFNAYLKQHFFHAGSTPLVRRVCFDTEGLYDEELQRHQDWDMFLRIARAYKFAAVSEPLVRVWQTEPPASALVLDAKQAFLRKFSRDMAALPLLERRDIYGWHHMTMASLLAEEAQWVRAARFLVRAAVQHPRYMSIGLRVLIKAVLSRRRAAGATARKHRVS